MHGLVLVINHSVFLDLRFGTASQKTPGRHTLLVVSRKDLSHIHIHLNDSVFVFLLILFYFGALIFLEKRPIRNCLYVCMYVCINCQIKPSFASRGSYSEHYDDFGIQMFLIDILIFDIHFPHIITGIKAFFEEKKLT